MTDKRTTVEIPSGVLAAIDGAVRSSGQTGDVPTLSQSQMIRLLLRDSTSRLVDGDLDLEEDVAEFIDPEDLAELIPDHKRAEYLREEVKAEGWYTDMKHGFEGRVRDILSKRFKNGYDPEGAAAKAQDLINEARIYWKVIEDDPETFNQKAAFIEERLEEYRAKYEVSDYNPNDEWLSYSGVESGREKQQIEQVAPEVIADLARRLGPTVNKDAVVDAVAKQHGVSRNAVMNLVDEIREGDRDVSIAVDGVRPVGSLDGVSDDD